MPALRLPSLVGFLIASELLAHGGGYAPPTPTPPTPPTPPTSRPASPGAPGGRYHGPGDTTPSSPGPSGPSAPTPSSPSPGGPTTGGTAGPSGSPAAPSTGGPAGPSAPAPSAPAGGGPATGGPSSPSAPAPAGARGPVTGGARGLPLENDFNTWDYWWEYNKNRFLMLRDVEARTVQTGSDDFYLGPTRRNTTDVLRPTAEQTVQIVLPALKRAIDGTTNRDIATACIVAMAKIGSDHPEFHLVDVFVPRLRVGDQEVRETAALALGLMSRNDTRSLPLLEGLALDAGAGRSAYGGPVDNRTRAFATYGLGLTAHGAVAVASKQRVFEILRQLVEGDGVDRNVKVAAIASLGLLAPNARTYDGRKLRDEALAVLGRWFERDLGAGDELVQAHCPTAIAKLLARGDAASARWCDRFASALAVDKSVRRRGNAIAQSCALALGQLAEPVPNASSPDHSDALLEASRSHPDALTRYFALIALGQIGGQDNCGALLKEFGRPGAGLRRPWCALALGLLVHDQRERQARGERGVAPDQFVVSTLHDALCSAKEPGLVGALGIALGLCGATEAAPVMRERLLDGVAKEQMAGYLCIGLALMQEKGAVEDIRKVMATAQRRSELLVQAAIALGRLGDREAAELMVERMTGDRANLVQLAAFATALSQIGDRRSIEPLVRMLHDDKAGALARAFAAAALGGISDWRRLPWNTPIGADINYRAAVETLTNTQTGILDIL
jgi:HEAT repeat protein